MPIVCKQQATKAQTHPGKAVQNIGHDQRLPQHEQQRGQHSGEEGSGHILLGTVPVPVVLAGAATHCHCCLSYNACRTGKEQPQYSRLYVNKQ